MDTPQEVEVWFVLPAIRRQLAICLKDVGTKQKDIATALNLTEPAVSQYLTKKRGEEIAFTKEALLEIKKSAIIIAEDNTKARSEIQRLMQTIKDSKFLCTVCNDHANTPSDCEICYR
jgi:predicted transcriptional regulator